MAASWDPAALPGVRSARLLNAHRVDGVDGVDDQDYRTTVTHTDSEVVISRE